MMGTQLFIQIDDETKRKFKSKVAEKGHKMKDVIHDAIEDYLDCDGNAKWLKTP